MKHTRLFAKLIALAAVTAVILSSGLLLFACNRRTVTLDNIYKSTTSAPEFTKAELEFTLPSGWEVYTSSVSNLGSDTGYIKSLNAFIIVKYEDPTVTQDKNKVVTAMSIIKCGDEKIYFDDDINGKGEKGILFPESLGIIAMRVKGNLIVCKFKSGEFGAFDINGKTVISRTKISIGSDTIGQVRSTNLDNVIKILDDKLIAVHASYDKSGVPGYTSIYRPTYTGANEQRGELVCRVANSDNAISYVNGFDGKYVSVVGNKSGDSVYLIPDTANGTPKSINAIENATLAKDDQDNYDSEITYIGDGRFFFHEMWTVKSTDDYDYSDGSKYWVFSRYIYTPDNNSRTRYNKNEDKVFLNLSNNYYDSKAGFDTNAYLNDGYTYASYGLFIVDKVAYYDQYILDKNLNIVRSLTDNFGITIKDQTKDKVGVFDLMLLKTDGYYYIPLAPSEVNVYDSKGNLVGHNDRTTVLRQELSNNVIIAAIEDPDDSKNTLYGAFNLKGEEIIEFKYTSLSAFRGSYTIGERYDENKRPVRVLIGEDGKEISELSNGAEPFGDIKNGVYKIGCYIFQQSQEIDGKTVNALGIKNFNPNVDENVVMAATMTECTLYAPSGSPSDIFVFELVGEKSKKFEFSYRVHRLV